MNITLKSLKRSLAGVALVGAVTLAGAGSASAQVVGPVNVTVAPGGRACVTSGTAFFKVRAEGSAPAAVGSTVQWSVHQSSVQIPGLTLTGNYYAGELNSSFNPQYFPGAFNFCVRNLSTTATLKATLTLKTDYDAG